MPKAEIVWQTIYNRYQRSYLVISIDTNSYLVVVHEPVASIADGHEWYLHNIAAHSNKSIWVGGTQ